MDAISNRRCWVEVDGRALRHNFKVLRGLIPRSTQIMAVVKANAYGHGLVAMAREFQAIGTNWLGVANTAEGVSLREAGVTVPILLLSATLPEEMPDAIRYHLTLILSSYEEALVLNRAAKKLGEQAEVHFKIDTGMGRLGCWHLRARDEMRQIRTLPGVLVKGILTHFTSADDNAELTAAQWDVISPFFAENPHLIRHAANSPAVTRRYGFHADLVRLGLGLYGTAPNPEDQGLGLRPVLTWKSRVTLLHEMAKGRTVSYGATYRLPARQMQAVVAMGYGDGYFRLHSNSSHMLVHGIRCPIRGRVTMDQIIIDVTHVPACRVGDEVVALGRQGNEEIQVRELATQAHTIPWEILTNIGPRVPRVSKYFHSSLGGGELLLKGRAKVRG